jgi:hypothetical protein
MMSALTTTAAKKRLDGATARHSIRDLEKGKLRSVRNQA